MYPSAMHPSGAALLRTLDLKFPKLLVYTHTRHLNCRQLGLPLNQKIYIYTYYAELYLFAGYIHLYCTGPPSLHSRTRCTTKWTMLVKNPGGNICSSLHKVIQTSPCSRSISSCDSLVEHMPLKNAEISTRGLTTLSGNDLRNAIGRSCCISMWLSWLFNPEIVRSLSRTHREMFEAYPSGTLTFRRTFRKFYLFSLDMV
jgi:hypothetical protein